VSTLLTLKQFSRELDFYSFSGLTLFASVEITLLQLGRSALKDSPEMSEFQCASVLKCSISLKLEINVHFCLNRGSIRHQESEAKAVLILDDTE
jgi:hypothetical protein